MRCSYCTRTAKHEFKGLNLCEECGRAFREGFEHGRVYDRIELRARFKRKVRE